MKIRSDFVSNSSSSSYIVACKASERDKVLKDIAKKCISPRSAWHDKNLKKKNLLALDFCTKTYQLLFLGSLLVKTTKEKYSLEYFKDAYRHTSNDAAAIEFGRYKKNVKDAKDELGSNKNVSTWLQRNYGRDEYAGNDSYWHYEDITASSVIVSNYIMESHLMRYHFTDNDGNELQDDAKTKKARVESIIKLANEYASYDYSDAEKFQSDVEIYSITLDTIANTKELIDFGCKISFSSWEDINMLERRLNDGEMVFYVKQAYQGDGYGDFYIYCEDGADGITNVVGIDIIGCET